jgi:hypothetical protein
VWLKQTDSSWIICAYFTDKYKDDAKGLVSTLDDFKVSYYIQNVPDLGSWAANTHYKPTFIKTCLKKFDKDIVYLDVDARLERHPELFDKLDVDIAFWRVPQVYGGYISNGTLFIRNCEETKDFCEKWQEACSHVNGKLEQTKFEEVLKGRSLKTSVLPIQYCQIFDYPEQGENPVIKHYQASRQHKQH